MGVLLAMSYMPKYSQLYSLSEKYILGWTRIPGGLERAQLLEVKGQRRLRIQVGNFYCFQRHTAFRVIGSIFYLTGKLILLLKT